MSRASFVKRWESAAAWRPTRRYDRNIYLLLLYTLGKGLQISIGALSINLYAFSLGYKQDFIGVLSAMLGLGALVAAVPIGLVADRYGRKWLLIISGVLNPLALVAVGLSTSATALIVASLVNGVLSSAYWVTNLPLLTESSRPDQRVSVLSLNSFLLLGVGSLGALIGGLVPQAVAHAMHVPATSVVPLRWGVLVAAAIAFLPAPWLLWLREPARGSQRPASASNALPTVSSVPALPAAAEFAVREPPTQTRRAARIAAGDSVEEDPAGALATIVLFVKLLLPDTLFTTGEGATVALLQIFLLVRFSVQPAALGVLYTLGGLCLGAMALSAPRIVRRWGKLRTATTMQLMSVPVVLVIGFAPFFPLAAAAEIGRNLLRGVFDPTYAVFAMERVSSRLRATLSGLYSVTWSIGYSIGPTIAGWLQVRAGLSTSFILSAVCIAAAAVMLRVFFPASLHAVPDRPPRTA